MTDRRARFAIGTALLLAGIGAVIMVAGASVQAVSDAAASGNGPWLHWSVRDASYSVVFLTGLCALASALWRSQRPSSR